MKKRFTVFSALVLMLSMLLTGCFGTGNDSKDSGKGVKVARTGNGLFVMANGSFRGAEIVIDKSVNSENIKFENGNWGIAKTENDKTIISIIRPSGEVKDGELLFSVYNTDEKMEIKATEVITSKEATKTYEKETKKITTRAAGDILIGDFNSDKIVDITDFTLFKAAYSATYSSKFDIAPALRASTDSNRADIYSKATPDGSISILDLIILGRNYGKTNPDISVKALTVSEAGIIKIGKTVTLTATVQYDNGTTSTTDTVTWTTSDSTKATVNSGVVTGVAAGTAVIKVEKDGISTTTTVTVEPVITGLVMHLKKPSAWSGANAYVWTGTGATSTKLSAAWPGTAMTADASHSGWYTITLADAKAPVNVAFNGNGTDAQKTANLSCTVQEAWFDGAAWIPDPWKPQAPTVSLSGGGTFKAGTYNITVTVTGDNVTVIKYTIDGTNPETSGKEIANGGKIAVTIAENETKTVKVYAKNGVGGSTAETVVKFGEVAKSTFDWRNASVYFVLTDRFLNGDKSNDNSYGRECDASGNPISGYESKGGTFHGGDLKALTTKITD